MFLCLAYYPAFSQEITLLILIFLQLKPNKFTPACFPPLQIVVILTRARYSNLDQLRTPTRFIINMSTFQPWSADREVQRRAWFNRRHRKQSVVSHGNSDMSWLHDKSIYDLKCAINKECVLVLFLFLKIGFEELTNILNGQWRFSREKWKRMVQKKESKEKRRTSESDPKIILNQTFAEIWER